MQQRRYRKGVWAHLADRRMTLEHLREVSSHEYEARRQQIAAAVLPFVPDAENAWRVADAALAVSPILDGRTVHLVVETLRRANAWDDATIERFLTDLQAEAERVHS